MATRSRAPAWERAESRRADGGLPYGQLVPTLLRGNALKDAPASRAEGAPYSVRKRKRCRAGGRRGGTPERPYMRSHAGAWERAESRRADGGLPYGQLVPTLLRGNALKDAPASRADGASYGVRKRKTWQGGRQAGRDAGASVYAFPRRSVGTSRGSGGLPIGNSFPRSCVGKSRKYGHLDSGSTLHFPVKKFPEKTESSYFIDTRVIYRFARNDDCRDDSL